VTLAVCGGVHDAWWLTGPTMPSAFGIGYVYGASVRSFHRNAKRGRPVTYNRDHYRRRSTIEQCVGWLKECRAAATRYEKLALNYLGLVKLAFIERYLRLLTRTITTI